MAGVDKAASDEANIFILRVILQDNKMVGSWFGWGRSNKKFWTKKDALNELMPLLQKNSNDVRSLWVPDNMLKVLVASVRAVTKKHVCLAQIVTYVTHVVKQP
jgi:hypothetical protein